MAGTLSYQTPLPSCTQTTQVKHTVDSAYLPHVRVVAFVAASHTRTLLPACTSYASQAGSPLLPKALLLLTHKNGLKPVSSVQQKIFAAGKRSPVLLKALPLGNKLVVSWLALGRPAQPQVLELDEARFVAEDPSSGAPSRTARPVHKILAKGLYFACQAFEAEIAELQLAAKDSMTATLVIAW